MVQIEFFHDAICSFCFPMSARMRKIAEKYDNIEISHRSFALGWTEDDFIGMFGSREAVKPEVLQHWKHANQNDDQHRFNIEGMREQDFLFPLSRPALLAAKAAGIVGGETMYWDVFDRIQHKLFVENKNVEDFIVLKEAVLATSVSYEDWEKQFQKKETEEKVLEDIAKARSYGVVSVPTLVVNGKYKISGARTIQELEQILQNIAKEEQLNLFAEGSNACQMNNGKWECN